MARAADRAYIKLFGLKAYREIGQEYGLEYAENFYYVGPGGTFVGCVDPEEVETIYY